MSTIHIRCARRRVFGDWRRQRGGQDSPDWQTAGEYCWLGRSGAIRGTDGLCFWERGGGSGRLVRGNGWGVYWRLRRDRVREDSWLLKSRRRISGRGFFLEKYD